MSNINYYKTRYLNPFRCKYLYVDTIDHMADKIFIDNKLGHIKFKQHFGSDKYPDLQIIFCTIRRSDEHLFLECMKKLYDNALICNIPYYDQLCNDVIPIIEASANEHSVEE